MKTELIRYYTILFQYLLLLKEPTYIFLIQIFHHLSPSLWWEEFIEPVLKYETKENFKHLDISDLLNVFKMNWDRIFRYLDKNHVKFKYDNEYRLVTKVHYIRNTIAHANDVAMSYTVFFDSLSALLKYARLIKAENDLVVKLENDYEKYFSQRPKTIVKKNKDDAIKNKILSIIEDRVLLKAKSCEELPSDIRLSMDRTLLRLQSMRTLDEVIGMFNSSMLTERGTIVCSALHSHKLLAFEDIKEEINRIYSASD